MISSQEIVKKRKLLGNKDKQLAEIFKTLSDANRCKIFRILATEAKLSVSSISKILNISLPLASQHLKKLLVKNMLLKEKAGQQVYYKLRKDNPVARSLLNVILKD